MVTAKKLPSGSWRTRVYVGKSADGKAQYVSITRRTERECIRDALEISTRHREVSRDSSTMTLGEAIDAYIAAKSNVLSPSTIRGYDQIKRNRFQPEMGEKLCKLTRQRMQTAINREALTCSPKTVRNAWGLVSAVMEAYADGPCKVTLPQKVKFVGYTLSADEIGRLIQALHDSPVEVPVLLALWLGLRRSELLALTWDAYDDVSHTLRISAAMVHNKDNKLVVKGTKTTESTRILPLPAYIYEKLDSAERAGEYIVPMHPTTLTKYYHLACDAAGIPRIRLHDLRYSNASVMLLLNVPDKYAMERGGWSTTQTLKKVYQNTVTPERKKVNQKIDRYFAKIANKCDTKNDTQKN